MKKNPTSRIEKRVNDTLKSLVNRGKINDQLHQALRISINSTRPPLFYGAAKTHKEDCPIRPIVSAVGSTTYNISKYVSGILTPYVRDAPSYIANTADLLQKVKTVSIEDDELLVSFDVKSLYTNVPRNDAMDTVRKLLENDPDFKIKHGIETATLLEILKLCLTTTHFQFRGEHYELSDGLPMGSPASPAIANLFMAKLEETALSPFAGDKPKVWYRFVDDVLSVVKTTAIDQLLTHLNSQHPTITFTIEREKDNQLPFLDTRIHRISGTLKTGVHRKPTHTGRYLHFESDHPLSAKRSVVKSLLDRLEYVTLGKEEIAKEKDLIRGELAANGYPRKFITEIAKKQRKRSHSTSKSNTHKPKGTATIPYVKGLSEPIARILGQLDIRTVMRPKKQKWSIMCGAKDRIKPQEDPGVVYAIGCMGCAKVYVGETNRTASQRAREHRCHTRTGHTELSAIAQHAHATGHPIHWEPRVLTKERHAQARKIKEAIAIQRLGPEKND